MFEARVHGLEMHTQLAKYQPLKKIASGGMAEIHLARQSGLEGFEKIVVIKKILPHLTSNGEFVQMFLDEARLAAMLTHPNIVQIYDLIKDEDSFSIVMEYIQGENLRNIAKTCRKHRILLPLQHAIKIASKASEALHYAHTKVDHAGQPLGVVHRDVSPQNILVSYDGMIKLVDFGIAKAKTQCQETRPGSIKGKLDYMSPEQVNGMEIDSRSDIFSLGIVLWEMFTGKRLYSNESDYQVLKEITLGKVIPPSKINSRIPNELDEIVLKALSKSSGKRFQDAMSMHLALEKFLNDNNMRCQPVHLANFMRKLFKDKYELDQKMEYSLASKQRIMSLLFDDLEIDSYKPPEATPQVPPEATPEAPPDFDSSSVSRISSLSRVSSCHSRVSSFSRMSGSLDKILPPVPKGHSSLPWIIMTLWALITLGIIVWLVFFLRKDNTQLQSFDPTNGVVHNVESAGIIINSQPEGGAVLLDGTLRCQTPCTIGQLPLGRQFTLEVRKDAYQNWTTSFTLEQANVFRKFDTTLESTVNPL